MVYGHANGEDDRGHGGGGRAQYVGWATGRSARSAACPGSPSTYGVGRGDMYYEPAENGLPPENALEHREVPAASCPTLFARLRKEFGPDLHLLHDVHHRLTPIEAARLGKCARAVPSLLDGGPGARRAAGGLPPDPPAHDDAARGGRGVQQHPRLPAAHPGAAHRLHPRRPSCTRAASATCARSRSLAELYHVRTGCHGATDLSPGLHGRRAALRPQRPQLRHPGVHAAHATRPTACSRTPTRSTDGCMHPGDAPGLGVDIDEALAAKYPVRAAPICR